MTNMSNIIQRELKSSDKLHHHYQTSYNKKKGRVVLTNNRLVFMEDRGFFRPSYHTVLEIPYDQITDVTAAASHRLEIATSRTLHTFVIQEETKAAIIEDEIRNLQKVS